MNIFKKRWPSWLIYFGNYGLRKTWLDKKSRLRGPLDRQHGKRAETLIQSQRQHFYHLLESLSRQFSSKGPLLVRWKILRLFWNKPTADDKLFLLSRENLMQPIHMHLSEKQKTFCLTFFLHFSNLHQILNIFKKRWPS